MDKAKLIYGLKMTVAVGFLVLTVISACVKFSDNIDEIKGTNN